MFSLWLALLQASTPVVLAGIILLHYHKIQGVYSLIAEDDGLLDFYAMQSGRSLLSFQKHC
jgi:hypothetical protein